MSGLVQLTGRQVKDHSLEVADLPLASSPGEILISSEVNGENVFLPKKHSELNVSNGIHPVHAFQFNSLEDRDSFIPEDTDIGKICRIGEHFYMLSSADPIKWSAFGAPSSELDSGGATTEYTVNDEIDGGHA